MVDGGTRLTEGISLNRRKILYAPAFAVLRKSSHYMVMLS